MCFDSLLKPSKTTVNGYLGQTHKNSENEETMATKISEAGKYDK